MAAMIFKAPPRLGQCSMSMSKTRLSSRAQLLRAGAPCACASSLEVSGGALVKRERFYCATSHWALKRHGSG